LSTTLPFLCFILSVRLPGALSSRRRNDHCPQIEKLADDEARGRLSKTVPELPHHRPLRATLALLEKRQPHCPQISGWWQPAC
jgi:hypothetical protein